MWMSTKTFGVPRSPTPVALGSRAQAGVGRPGVRGARVGRGAAGAAGADLVVLFAGSRDPPRGH